MKKYSKAAVCFISAVSAGCGMNEYNAVQENVSTEFTLYVSDMDGDSSMAEESTIMNLSGFRFEDGILTEKFENIEPDRKGSFRLIFTEGKRGTVHFWANASEMTEDAGFETGLTSEEEFLEYTSTVGEMTAGGITMTAEVSLDGTDDNIRAGMKRSVARLDIRSEFGDTEVMKVTLKDICLSGKVNCTKADSENALKTDIVEDFTDRPFSGGTKKLFYLCEQPDGIYEIEVDVMVSGAWRKLRSTLGSIKRNTVYTVTVLGNGADTEISVSEGEWETGEGSVSGISKKCGIDIGSSVLSEGVRVNETGDTVFIPHTGCQMKLAVKAENATGTETKGRIEGLEIRNNKERSMEGLASFDISCSLRVPGKKQEFMYIDILSGTDRTGRIVIAAESNPSSVSGEIVFDANGSCDFGKYIDGNLGTITVPEGKTARVASADGERPWIRVVETAENTFRIDGGWKPNDPEADGRIQNARIIISDIDGSHPESYTVSRRNLGLPVVNIAGTWWCKYNLRGNVKDFGDQISIAEDPVKEGNIAEYLATCSDEEFLDISGDQYQAGNPEGLTIKEGGVSFVYDGFNSTNSIDFGTSDPHSMAPDGYMIPDYDDFGFFTWSDNSNMGYGSDAFSNRLGERIHYTIAERNLSVNGKDYGSVQIYDFCHDGIHWVLTGLGHQFNENEIAKYSIIFATSGNGGRSWMMEGYPESSGKGNWYKYTNHNTVKTRTIRCVKTPVEYIYD